MSRVIAGVLSGALLLALAVPGATQKDHSKSTEIDCTECHTCAQPSEAKPCLRPSLCPRHQGGTDYDAHPGPETVILDELENIYGPVLFHHEAHARMVRLSEGCETCHHFTPPYSEHPACKDCHPPDIPHEDLAQPGLKGAYHRGCMKCHREWDNDTACEVCHVRKSAAGAEQPEGLPHGHYEPVPMDDLILFPTAFDDGDQVPFHHKNHADLYERDCGECHQHQSCKRCHVHGEELHPMGALEETDLHEVCFQCHKEERCGDCHGRDPDDLFRHASTGWPLRSFHKNLNCCACHTKQGAFLKLDPRCETCHRGGWSAETFDHRITGVRLDEIHVEMDCEDCHASGIGKTSSCDACHDDGRTYSTTGFPEE